MDNNVSETVSMNQPGFNFNFNNFNPEEIETEQTINIVFAIDVSPSISPYQDELNNSLNEFYEEMQKSHVADQILVSIVTFNEDVKVETGFQPISNIPSANYKGHGWSTSLYDGTLAALENAVKYREDLEDSGVMVKTLLFVITDGMDNDSSNSPSAVKNKIDDLMLDEKNMHTFTSVLFGVGDKNNQSQFNQIETYFTNAKEQMGIQHLAMVGNTAQEIRKMINLISSSVSQISSNQAVSMPNF